MAFLQQQQQQSDGFQNLLGILKANRERDNDDLTRFHSGNLAESKRARKELISHGVIDEWDTLDGIQSGIEKQVKAAEGTKAGENTTLGKTVGNGYMASKLGQQGHAEQQTYADAGNAKLLENARKIHGKAVAMDKMGNLVWTKEDGSPSSSVLDDASMAKVVNQSGTGQKMDATGEVSGEARKGVDALRYASQMDADKKTASAFAAPVSSLEELRAAKKKNPNLQADLYARDRVAQENADAFAKEGESLKTPQINQEQMQQKDNADAVREAQGKIVAKAGDVNKIFDAANNESGNAQYNYARGKQYIEDMMPAGPARDAAVNRYSEMFMQQQLVGKEGAYMGNIYDKDKGRGHTGPSGAKEKIAMIGDQTLGKAKKFNYSGYATPEEMNAGRNGDRRDFLKQWAITFHGGNEKIIDPKVVKYSDPAMWDQRERNLFESFDTKALRSGIKDLDSIDEEKYNALIAKRVPEAEARAQARVVPKKVLSEEEKAALGGSEQGIGATLQNWITGGKR